MASIPTPDDNRRELTLRGVLIGIIATVALTAANVFFGLKAGLTFSTSIPAAVVSMAILRWLGGATVQENNIVQTIASAAGTLSSIIFVLPGLVMIGWWNDFPYWTSFWICALGGILGVMYSIPLRRALVTNSDLPYPEGIACAEVLKVGSGDASAAHGSAVGVEAGRAGLLAVVWGSIVSAVFAVVVATQVFAASVKSYFHIGDKGSATGFEFSLSFALFAVGHLVGLWVGIAMLLGAVIGWGVAIPYLTALHPGTGTAEEIAGAIWSTKVRYIGAGAIAIAAIWTLAKLVGPVTQGLRSAMAASKVRASGDAASLPRTERDIPVGWMAAITLACFVPIGWLLGAFGTTGGLQAQLPVLIVGGLAYVVLMSFFVSVVCGYMAGLIGSSNSPLSGVGIIVVIGASLLLVFAVKPHVGPEAGKALVAFALFVTAVIFSVASIANNNLQDLKTGQLVDATPWRQQVALLIGVIAGAAVIPPVLDLVQQAYGFAGAPGAGPQALAAPQAGLISSLAQGVIENSIDWNLIGIGVAIGVALIVLDVVIGKVIKGAHLAPMAVGLGIYLPTSATLMVVVGAIVGWYYDKRAERGANAEGVKQLGVLLASGLIVGESLMLIVLAALVVFWRPDPIKLVGAGFAMPGLVLGGVAFAAVTFVLYRWVARLGRQ
jgi:putative OPT family oligopeptide transporter